MDSSAITLLVILLIIFLVIVFIIKHKIIIGSALPEIKETYFTLNDDIDFENPAQKGFSFNFEKFIETYSDIFTMVHNGKTIFFELFKTSDSYMFYGGDHGVYGLVLVFNQNFSESNYGINTICSLHKTENFRGIELLELGLDISKKFGASKTTLQDGATYLCNQEGRSIKMFRSVVKMLECDETYYMTAGFKFLDVNVEHAATLAVNNIRTIKSTELKKYYEQLIKNMEMTDSIFIYSCFDSDSCTRATSKDTMIKKYNKMVDILNKYSSNGEFDDGRKYNYFYKLMIYLFKHSCSEYSYLYNGLTNDYKKMKINDIIVENVYSQYFANLRTFLIYQYFIYYHDNMKTDKKIFYLSDGNPSTDILTAFNTKYGNDLYISYRNKILKLESTGSDGSCKTNLIISDDKILMTIKIYNNNECTTAINEIKSREGIKMRELLSAIYARFNIREKI